MTTETSTEWPSSSADRKPADSPLPKHWFRYVLTSNRWQYSHVILMSFVINVFALATPLFIRQIYDRVIPEHALNIVWLLVLAVLSVLIFDFVLRVLRAYLIDNVGKNIDIHVSTQLFSRLLGIKLEARPDSVGSLANSIQAFDAFREFMTSATLSTLVDLPFVILFLALIAVFGGNLVWVPIVAIPIILSLSVLIQIPLARLIREAFQYTTKKQALLIESLSSLETIKALGAENPLQDRYAELSKEAASIINKTKFFSGLASHFALFAQTVASILLVVVGVYRISAGDLSVGALVACSLLSARALSPIAQIALLISRYQQAKAGYNAVDELMNLRLERPLEARFIHRANLQGDIELSELSFHYPSASISALKSTSLRIKSGERVGIIGRSGSGKSTLAKMIMKFYEPTSGQIRLDGIDLQRWDPSPLRRQIGYVPQDVYLFKGSLRDNILMGTQDVEESAFMRAAQLSGVLSFVENHPEGFDRAIGERGEGLSGGQRQAIAIARALLQDPSLLLFDEPCNGIDEKSTQSLIERLAPIIANKTLVLVTHKLALLKWVDRIIVMDNGVIVADGQKEQIIKQLSDSQLTVPVGS